MYVKNIKIKNYGILEEINFSAQFNKEGNPLPILLLGKNGTGKTLFLSQILDAFIEFKKKIFTQKIPELGNNDDYLKVLSPQYISYGKDFSYIEVEFHSTTNITYKSYVTTLSIEELKKKEPSLADAGFLLDNKSEKIIITKDNENLYPIWNTGVLLYFPHSRYDHPKWLRKDFPIGFKMQNAYRGISETNIIKTNDIDDIKCWILDCLLDQSLYERDSTGKLTNGINTKILNIVNETLGKIFKLKYPNLEYVRTGTTRKNYRETTIVAKFLKSPAEERITHGFDFLSSGEVMILSLLCSIIKDADEKGLLKNNTDLSSIEGIVVIDEIDLHAHLEHQKELLPKILKLFPKIQFILSTHSPFFLLGIQEELLGKYTTLNMPSGDEIDLNNFSEIKQAYAVFKNGIEKIQNEIINLNIEIKNLKAQNRDIIITEGKTDWMHLKAALRKLKEQGKMKDMPEFFFLEYSENMGDSMLMNTCKMFSRIPNNRKIIFIFDRDNPNVLKEMGDSDDAKLPYKCHMNNVYSFCIPTPSHRQGHTGISIELFYKDKDLKRLDNEQRRIFLSNEFTERGVCCSNQDLRFSNYRKLKGHINDNTFFIIDEDVINEAGENVALSKYNFAKLVSQDSEQSEPIDFSEFEKIFEIIKSILNKQ